MKAIVQEAYGSPDDLQLKDIETPTIRRDEVLVRVRAASVHPDVSHVLRGTPYVLRAMGAGVRRPRRVVPGTDVAGVVTAVGAEVTGLAPGDEVFGETMRGHQWHNGGAYAEFVAVPAAALVPKPASVSFEEAAAVPTSGLVAYQAVRSQGRVGPGQRVLVNGAAGGVGAYAVQLARVFGARVTGVDHGSKLDLVRLVGADQVLDYTLHDFTRVGGRYDVIVDIPGNRSVSDIRRALKPTGTYVLVGHDHYGQAGRWVGASLRRFARLAVTSPFVTQQLSPAIAKPGEPPLAYLAELLEEGSLVPVVDRVFPLAETVEAIRYLESGQARGKVVISI
jgi:NADPH:quinone reductase-like Zn-dependent oxidoreductase